LLHGNVNIASDRCSNARQGKGIKSPNKEKRAVEVSFKNANCCARQQTGKSRRIMPDAPGPAPTLHFCMCQGGAVYSLGQSRAWCSLIRGLAVSNYCLGPGRLRPKISLAFSSCHDLHSERRHLHSAWASGGRNASPAMLITHVCYIVSTV
jgi:hypothetical protein